MPKQSAKGTIILINGYSFCSYFSAFDANADAGKIDVTCFCDAAENYVPGMPTAVVTGDVFWDSAADKTHLALKSMPTGYVTIIPGGYTLGTNTISLPFMQGNYGVNGDPKSALKIGTLNFESYGDNYGIENGVALQHGNITTTTTGTGVLDPTDAAVVARCSGTLHIWQACASDTYVIKIQHSTLLGSGYADLVTFTLNGSAIGAEQVKVASGTINKYRRVIATRTGSAGDSLGFSVHFQHQ